MKSKGLKTHIIPLKDLVHLVKLSRSRYQEYLRQPRKESKENETTQLSSLNGNIKEIELWKKALIIAFCDSMDKEFLELAEKAEKKKKTRFKFDVKRHSLEEKSR